MRVIAGTAKGKRLFTPKTNTIRPVLDQVKEAIFSILWDVKGLTVLDLYAGTGSMGIEALSRGASKAVFVDKDREAVRLIHKNLETCHFAEHGRIFPISVGKAIANLEASGESFDLIFVDPPYQQRLIEKTFSKLANSLLITEKTRMVTEHHPKEPFPEIEGLILTDQRKYGQTLVSIIRKK